MPQFFLPRVHLPWKNACVALVFSPTSFSSEVVTSKSLILRKGEGFDQRAQSILCDFCSFTVTNSASSVGVSYFDLHFPFSFLYPPSSNRVN